jgi:hypothetical protein
MQLQQSSPKGKESLTIWLQNQKIKNSNPADFNKTKLVPRNNEQVKKKLAAVASKHVLIWKS